MTKNNRSDNNDDDSVSDNDSDNNKNNYYDINKLHIRTLCKFCVITYHR